MKVSIIIPAYNEAATIAEIVSQVSAQRLQEMIWKHATLLQNASDVVPVMPMFCASRIFVDIGEPGRHSRVAPHITIFRQEDKRDAELRRQGRIDHWSK